MNKWKTDFISLLKNKYYIVVLILTGICSYGYLITHGTIGIDDTPYSYYFQEGLVTIVGRWVLFSLNKIVSISEFSPFLTDLAGVIILMFAATIWCVFLYRIFKEKVPFIGYLFFAALFISNPLHSEVYTYFLHNGISIGFLCCGISLCFLKQVWEDWGKARIQKIIALFAGSGVFLWIALGCYESFAVVFLVGICILVISNFLVGDRKKVKEILGFLLGAVAAILFAIILRSILTNLLISIFNLEALLDQAVHRSLGEMMGWIFEEGGISTFYMELKKLFVQYIVFGYAYYPIGIYVLGSGFLFFFMIVQSIKKKNPWIFIWYIFAYMASFSLVLIEGSATLYRSAQFLPLFSAWALFVFIYAISKVQFKEKKVGIYIGSFCLSVILWNQCGDMNQWFYIDDLKYQAAKNTMNQIAYELEKNFDTSKPIIFTGTYEIPKSIIQKAYVEYHSDTFYKINNITQKIDPHLLEKFYRGHYGVWVAQTPSLSVIDWGRYAFDNNRELIRFFALHGHQLLPQMDFSLYEGAEEFSMSLPSFPKDGSIVDMGEYIIVHF